MEMSKNSHGNRNIFQNPYSIYFSIIMFFVVCVCAWFAIQNDARQVACCMGCSIQKSAQWWGASNADPGCPLLRGVEPPNSRRIPEWESPWGKDRCSICSMYVYIYIYISI